VNTARQAGSALGTLLLTLQRGRRPVSADEPESDTRGQDRLQQLR
jgi:hypothetical protein